jgi:hypothetical protein
MKKLTAKKARKLAQNNFDLVKTTDEFETLLGKYIELGFTNMNADVSLDILKDLELDLVERDFRVWVKAYEKLAVMEVEW